MPKFIHADNCALYAEDAAECSEPWLRWQYRSIGGMWVDADGPFPFLPNVVYRRKPRTIRINGFEVPEPVREPLEKGQWYWLAENTRSTPVAYQWSNDKADYQWLDAGLLHMTEEAAQIHIDAMLSFTRRGE